MENVEVKNEVVETTTNKSKGFVVGGMLVAALAAVGTWVYKKFRKNKVEVVEEPIANEEIFEGINEEIK